MPVNGGGDDNFYIQVLSLILEMLHYSCLKTQGEFLAKVWTQSHIKGPLDRQSSQGCCGKYRLTRYVDHINKNCTFIDIGQAEEFINTSENIL